MESLLIATGLTKRYGATLALSAVDFELREGEVHALVGENGAGKSTLSKVVCGIVRPDAGEMRLTDDGRARLPLSRGSAGASPSRENLLFSPTSRRHAEHLGVRIVLQELNLIPTLSIAENIYLDCLPHRMGVVNYRVLNERAHRVMAEVGLAGIDPSRPVSTLGVGQCQLVEIARALSTDCRVLILDEPTAALTDREVDLLFTQVRRIRAAGTGIIYISHRMEEIRALADRVTVLRDGQHVATRAMSEVTHADIVRMMVGRDMADSIIHRAATPGETIMRVRGLSRGDAVRDVSFDLRRGEILGFAGLMGSGRTETMRAIFGADRRDSGDIFLHGNPAPARIRSPRQAVRQGIGLLTEDRKAQGILLPLSIRWNTTLTKLAPFARLGWISFREEEAAAQRYVDMLTIRCRGTMQQAGTLSGGNQQKVVLAKWLLRDCDVLIFDEPTRGIDVGAKFEIHRLLAQLADAGKGIIVVSSDLPELLAVSNRINVMSAGRLVRTFERGEWTQDRIMEAALSGHVSGIPAGTASAAESITTT